MFEREYRDLAHVPRWGIMPVIKRQSVAEHSYFVTLYAYHICEALNLEGPIVTATLKHCVEHDRSEVYTSDIPGPVKRAVGKEAHDAYVKAEDPKRFTTPDGSGNKVAVAIRKLADLMDEYAYLTSEFDIGNSNVGPAITDIETRVMYAAASLAALTSNDVWGRVVVPFYDGHTKEKVMPKAENSDVETKR